MFLIVGVLYSLMWFRSKVILYRWDSIVRFSVNIWLVGDWFLEQLCFYEITKMERKERAELSFSWNWHVLLSVLIGICSAQASGPWFLSCVPVLGMRSRGLFAKKRKVGKRRVMTWGKQTYQYVSITNHYKNIFSGIFFDCFNCACWTNCIFLPSGWSISPKLFVCLAVLSCLNVRRSTRKYALKDMH